MIYLEQLVLELNRLVPVESLSTKKSEIATVVTAGVPILLLSKPDLGSAKAYTPAGEEITAAIFDYIAGTVNLGSSYATGAKSIITFSSSSGTDGIIERAVRDLGLRLPQKSVTHIQFIAGVATLPDQLSSIIEIREVVTAGTVESVTCLADGDEYECSSCKIYIRGNKVIMHPVPTESVTAEICYLGGFPINGAGIFEGLSRDYADIAMLKALSLAYGEIGSYVTASNALSAAGSGDKCDSKLIEYQFRIADESTQKKWESRTDASEFMGKQTDSFQATAQFYNEMYEHRIILVDGLTKGKPRRGGYRVKNFRSAW